MYQQLFLKLMKSGGLEMIKEINDLNPNIPYIITSAHSLEKIDLPTCTYKYMVKPFNIKSLLEESIKMIERK